MEQKNQRTYSPIIILIKQNFMKQLLLFLTLVTCLNLTAQNKSLQFDGIDDNVLLGKNLGFTLNDLFTVEAWIKTDANTGGYRQIISKLDAGFRGWGFQLINGNIEGYFISTFGSDNVYVNGTINVSDNQWHHVAMVHDGGGKVNLFVDGIQETTTVSGGVSGTVVNNAPTRIGCYDANGNLGEFWDGYIDELRVWDINLSASQIAANYLNEISGLEPNLIRYYKMDTTTTDVLCDVIDCSVSQINGVRQPANPPVFSTDIPTISDVPCQASNQCIISRIEEPVKNELMVYPNPTSENLTIKGLEKHQYEVSIFTAAGQKIENFSFQNGIVNVANLQRGVYIIVLNENGRFWNKKIVKY